MGNLDPPVFFGEWLKHQRRKRDLTQDELALQVGCSVFALRKIESGERRPSKQLASLLAKALEIPHEDHETFIRVARGDLRLERLPHPLPHNRIAQLALIHSPSTPVHLPLPPTPLVGRETDLAAMERIFHTPHCRLLTITGPGGIGKTRLAIEFASHQVKAFPSGIYYISLTSLSSASHIIPAIADTLNYTFSGSNEPKDQLVRHIMSLGPHPLLLVLDNMEHLLAPQGTSLVEQGAAHVVSELLQCLPHLKLVLTSRERINLRGEWTYELHGLPTPPVELVNCVEEYSSATLFLQSAKRVQAGFELTHENQAVIAEICRYVEGIPLAIELAAAWVNVLTVDEIACEIHSSLDLLTTSLRDIPDRHRSIQATFDHSWTLLSEAEQAVMCKLAIFRGAFDRQAATQIAGASLQDLASLVAKSLVQHTEGGGYVLHEVIRQYSINHLVKNPQYISARNLHCEYFLNMLHAREKALKSSAQQQALRELQDKLDDIRAAWDWAIEHQYLELLDSAIRCLGWFFETAGLLQEGIDLFAELIQIMPDQPTDSISPLKRQVWGKTLAQQCLLYFRKGQFNQARLGLENSLVILRSLSNPALLVDPLIYLGVIQHLDGELERSRALLSECLEASRISNDEWFSAYAIFNLGYVNSLEGRYAEATIQMREGLEIWRTLGDPHSISLGLNYLAPTLIYLGHFDEVINNLQESIRLSNQTRNRWGAGVAYRFLGLAYLAQGHLIEAQELLSKSLETFSGYITGLDLALTKCYLANVYLASGDLDQAANTYCDSLRNALDANSIPLQLDAILGLAEIQVQAGDCERAIPLAITVQNHCLSTLEAKLEAKKLLTMIESKLPTDQFQNAYSQAIRQTLPALIDEFIRNDPL